MKTSSLYVITGSYLSKEKLIDLTKGEISEKNIEIIHEHLLYPELREYINGFIEQNGILFFKLESGDMISVEPKSKQNLT